MSAPGKSFRKGLSFVGITRMFPDDATAERWFTQIRWPDGPHCPYCGSVNILSGAKHKTMPYRCREKECRKRFSVRTASPLDSSNIGFQVWAIAIYLLTTSLKGVSSMKLHRDLGITQKTAWFLAHRLRETWWDDDPSQFFGPVEIDETYMGGKRKNMHAGRRKQIRAEHGRGGSSEKAVVVGAKDRGTNRVSAQVIEGTDAKTLQGFVHNHTGDGATVYTDDARAYLGMKGVKHEAVRHSAGEYVRDMAHTNGIESFWSMLKRGYIGTYHKMSPQHLQRYVNEFTGRHNVRSLDTVDQMAGVVRGMSGKRLRYRDLTA